MLALALSSPRGAILARTYAHGLKFSTHAPHVPYLRMHLEVVCMP